MKIHGTENLSVEEVNAALQGGAKFVVFPYCISIFVMSFKRSSDIYFVRAENRYGLQRALYSLVSVLLGWWGIPWGPIWTISTLYSTLTGGTDVTASVLASVNAQNPIPLAPDARPAS